MKTEKKAREVNKRQSPVLRRLLLILLGLILGVNAYLANARNIVGNALPMPFGYGIANVLSGSMEPTFSKGALLLVKETDEVQTGDIVVYQSGKELIVHRVIEVDADTVVTQGDANNVADEPFPITFVRGKVIGWIPGLGAVAEVLKKPLATVLMIAAALYLLERSFQRQKKEDDEKLEAIKEEIRRLKQENEKQ